MEPTNVKFFHTTWPWWQEAFAMPVLWKRALNFTGKMAKLRRFFDRAGIAYKWHALSLPKAMVMQTRVVSRHIIIGWNLVGVTRAHAGILIAGGHGPWCRRRRGVENGDKISPFPPSRLGDLGSTVSSPSGVRGRALAKNDFSAFYMWHNNASRCNVVVNWGLISWHLLIGSKLKFNSYNQKRHRPICKKNLLTSWKQYNVMCSILYITDSLSSAHSDLFFVRLYACWLFLLTICILRSKK